MKKFDDETVKLMREMGVQIEADGLDDRRFFGRSGLNVRRAWKAITGAAVTDDDWDGEVGLLFEPYSTTVPVEMAQGEIVPDPFRFALEFSERPSPDLIAEITEAVAAITQPETSDPADHVSNWSAAEEAPGIPPALPRVEWHLDVAAARPATIRRVIESTAAFAATLQPAPIRMLVGDFGD